MSGVPLVFDYLHHALVPGGWGEREALEAALATWPAGVRPVVHYRYARRAAAGAGAVWRFLSPPYPTAPHARTHASPRPVPPLPRPSASRPRTRRKLGVRTLAC